MSVDELHRDLAGALEVTAKELTDVLDLAEQTLRLIDRRLGQVGWTGPETDRALGGPITLLREWHVGSRHSTGIARRAGVMERYRAVVADAEGTLDL